MTDYESVLTELVRENRESILADHQTIFVWPDEQSFHAWAGAENRSLLAPPSVLRTATMPVTEPCDACQPHPQAQVAVINLCVYTPKGIRVLYRRTAQRASDHTTESYSLQERHSKH